MTTSAQNSRQILSQSGSAAVPGHSFLGSYTTGMYLAGTNQLGFSTAGTTAMTVDASQNVIIGATTATAKFSMNGGAAQFSSSGSAFPSGGTGIEIVGNTDGNTNYIQAYNRTLLTWQTLSIGGSSLIFGTGGSERMRIDTSGNLLVGQTSDSISAKMSATSSTNTSHFITTAAANAGGAANLERNSAGILMNFRYNGADISGANISTSAGTSVAYNVGSDYRLKYNLQNMFGGIATISALQPITYNWISDNSQGEGFIAHELQAVIPLAVTGEKDAIDADGKPLYQGVDYSKIVVHLVAAIQELSAKVAALEANATKVA